MSSEIQHDSEAHLLLLACRTQAFLVNSGLELGARATLVEDLAHLRYLLQRTQQEWIAVRVHEGLGRAGPEQADEIIALRIASIWKYVRGIRNREDFEWEWRHYGWLTEAEDGPHVPLADRISD